MFSNYAESLQKRLRERKTERTVLAKTAETTEKANRRGFL